MNKQKATYFRNRFRAARTAVEKDDKDCMEIIHVLEDFGQVLTGKMQEIERYADRIKKFVHDRSSDDKVDSNYHIDFDRLYTVVRQGRNRAAHEGARSRYFAPRVIELSLMMEDALMSGADADKLKDYMVANPVVAQTWMPLSAIRKMMLTNSFTHIPYFKDGKWYVVSDANIVCYLRPCGRYKKSRMGHTLNKALSNGMSSCEPLAVCPDDLVKDTLNKLNKGCIPLSLPILVRHSKHNEHLLGILTASDLM